MTAADPARALPGGLESGRRSAVSGLEIAPLRGLRYDTSRIGKASNGAARAVTAPPYDVISLEEHRRLRAVVAALPEDAWGKRPPGSTHTVARLVFGAALHDTYHAGQIQLLKRLAGAPKGSRAR